MTKLFVTINSKPFGAAFSRTEQSAIELAKQAKAEFPNADVVAWCQSRKEEPFELWENGNTAND